MPPAEAARELYADGTWSGNPGRGVWAYIVRNRGTGVVVERSGGDPATTNNRMELMSVIEGLGDLDGPSRVQLYSDSQYVCKGISDWLDQWLARGWKRGPGGHSPFLHASIRPERCPNARGCL